MTGLEMTSDAWRQYGVMLFTKDSIGWERFLDGKGPLPKHETFQYWCSSCKTAWASILTPRKCPSGCKAEDVDDRVMLTHKSYTAATFPFLTLQTAGDTERTRSDERSSD